MAKSRAVGENLTDAEASGSTTRRKVVAPGFIDMHHLRDPGQKYKEDIVTGTRRGGARRLHGGLLHAQH